MDRPRIEQMQEKVKFSYDWYYEDNNNLDISDFYAELERLDKQLQEWVNYKNEERAFENAINKSRLIFVILITATIFGLSGLLAGVFSVPYVRSITRNIANKFVTTLNDSSYLELDDFVRKNLDEAEKCFKAGLYMASAVMLGKTLESALAIYYEKKTDKKAPDSFEDLLNWAHQHQHIPEEQFKEGRAIKWLRNIAAHYKPKVEITKNKVASIHEDLLKILEHLK